MAYNILNNLRTANIDWTGQQSFAQRVQMAEVAAPAAPSVGSNIGYLHLGADGHLYLVNDAGQTLKLSIVSHADLANLSGDDHPQYPVMAGRSTQNQFLVASTTPGARLTLAGSSDLTDPGDVAVGTTVVLDDTNKIVGIGELDPVPGLGPLQVGGKVRINNALDPGNVHLRVAVVPTETHGTVAAGVLLIEDEATGGILVANLFQRGSFVPPVTSQKVLRVRWSITAGVTTYFDDTFNRADASALGTSTSGHAYQFMAGTMGIVSNQAGGTAKTFGGTGVTGSFAVSPPLGQVNGVVRCTFPVWNNGQHLIFRFFGVSEYWSLGIRQPGGAGTQHYRLYKYDTTSILGNGTNMGDSAAGLPANGDQLEVSLSGANIVVRVNGNQILAVTDSFASTTGDSVGIAQTNTGGALNSTFENLSFKSA